MRHPFFDLPKPLVVGHRGCSGELPENTLAAFERALAQGAVLIETDVHLSRDGEVVIHHDADLTRTTEDAGPLAERTLAELRRLDAGHRFCPDGRSYPERGKGHGLPTLREAFDAFPGVHFNVEIKANDPALVSATLDLLREMKRADSVLLAAGEDDTMKTLRGALAESDVQPAQGASLGDIVGFVRAAQDGSAPPPEPMALQIPPSFGGNPLVTPELVTFAHEHDTEVHVWTVNDPAEMARLLDLGVDGVMSDFPGRLAEIVASRARA